jgi:hypothetical protein
MGVWIRWNSAFRAGCSCWWGVARGVLHLQRGPWADLSKLFKNLFMHKGTKHQMMMMKVFLLCNSKLEFSICEGGCATARSVTRWKVWAQKQITSIVSSLKVGHNSMLLTAVRGLNVAHSGNFIYALENVTRKFSSNYLNFADLKLSHRLEQNIATCFD